VHNVALCFEGRVLRLLYGTDLRLLNAAETGLDEPAYDKHPMNFTR